MPISTDRKVKLMDLPDGEVSCWENDAQRQWWPMHHLAMPFECGFQVVRVWEIVQKHTCSEAGLSCTECKMDVFHRTE